MDGTPDFKLHIFCIFSEVSFMCIIVQWWVNRECTSLHEICHIFGRVASVSNFLVKQVQTDKTIVIP